MIAGGLVGLRLAGAPGYCWECNQSVLLRSSPATIACSGPESAENHRISPQSLHPPIPSVPKTVSSLHLSHFPSLSVSHPLQANCTSHQLPLFSGFKHRPHLQNLSLCHSQFLAIPCFKLVQDLHFQGCSARAGAGGWEV